MAAVHDGYLLTKSIVRAPVGGQLLSHCMLQSAQAKGTVVQPAYSFKRAQTAAGQWEVRRCSALSFPLPLEYLADYILRAAQGLERQMTPSAQQTLYCKS